MCPSIILADPRDGTDISGVILVFISIPFFCNSVNMICRCNENVIYSRDKLSMEILFWNIQSFKQLHRNLVSFLD